MRRCSVQVQDLRPSELSEYSSTMVEKEKDQVPESEANKSGELSDEALGGVAGGSSFERFQYSEV
jgi:hypothetical protein